MWLHFTVPCNTHALIFLALVRSHVLLPLSVVASSAESLLFTANSATTVAASARSLYSPPDTYSLAATAGSRRLQLLHSTSQLNCSLWTHCSLLCNSLQLLGWNTHSAVSYIAGEHGCSLLLCYIVFTVLILRVHPPPSNCCVILITRHTLLLRGRLATVVNKCHIVCSVHVTSTVAWSPSNGCKQTLPLLTLLTHSMHITLLYSEKYLSSTWISNITVYK
jgi:hypothetical protein